MSTGELEQHSSVGEQAPAHKMSFQPGLEGLRGIAVFIVLVVHGAQFVAPNTVSWLLPGGFYAVDIFFVLSGFFITGMIMGRLEGGGKLGYARYFGRRIQRLYPPLILFLVAYMLRSWWFQLEWWGTSPRLGPHSPISQGTIPNVLWVLGIASNFQVSMGIQPRFELAHLWTIAAEVQFYLIWPFVMFVLIRYVRKTRWIVAIIALIGLAFIGIRYLEWDRWRANPFWPHVIDERTESWVDAIACGAIVSVLWRRGKLPVQAIRRLAIPAVIVLVYSIWFIHLGSPFIYKGGFTIGAVCGGIIAADILRPDSAIGNLLSKTPFRLLGRMSYTLYLWHLMVFLTIRHEFPDLNHGVMLVFGVVASIAVSALAWAIAERPVLRLPKFRRSSTTRSVA